MKPRINPLLRLTAALAFTATAHAADGVFSWTALGGGNNDANVGLSTSKTYLNAVNVQGSALTINGVSFESSSGGNPTGTNYAISGGVSNVFGSGAAGNVGGQLGSLIDGFIYGGNPQTLTLNNLTAGQTYSVALYNRSWDQGTGRTQTITTTGGATTVFNEDFNTSGDLNLLRYTFTATGTSESINFANNGSATYHFYGFSTEQTFNNTWSSGADWTSASWSLAQPNGVGSNADFTAQGSPTSINLDANRTVGHIRFNGANAWTISGANTLTMQADAGGVSVLGASSGTHTISTAVTLNSTLFKSGAGTVNLTTAVSGTGGITVGAGTLNLTAVSDYSGGTTVNGGTLILDGASGGTSRIRGALTVNSGGTVSLINGDPTGLGYTPGAKVTSLTINGGTVTTADASHVWNLSGVNMTGGTLQSNNGVSDPNGSQLEWNYADVTTNASANTATIGGRINMRADGGYGGISFNVADGAASTDLLVSAAVTQASGGLGISKSGAGTMVLSGNNSYSGVTTLGGGILNVASIANNGTNSSLGVGTGDTDPGAIGLLFRGGTLQYTGSTAQSTNRHIRLSTTGGGGAIDASGSDPSATLSFTASSSLNFFEDPGNRTLRLTGSNTGDNTFAMAIGEAGGTTSLVKSGSGKWLVTGSSSYSGVTTLEGGILNVASIANNGTSSSLGVGTGDTDPEAIGLLFRGGTLQYTGSTAQSTNRAIRLGLEGGTIDASGSDPSATLSFTATASPNLFFAPGNRTLTLTGSNTGDNTFSMAIGQAGGTTSLVKSGTGKWVLSGSSNYSGLTTIQQGTLVAASSNALGTGGWDGNTMSFISDGATLALQGGVSLDEHFHVWGSGVGGLGAVRSISGNNALTMTFGGGGSGPGFALRSNTTVGVDADTLTATGFYEDGGSWGLTKVGAGTLKFTQSNNYTGGTNVSQGMLVLAAGAWTLNNVGGGGVTVGSGATLRADNSVANQLNGLTLNGGTVDAINSGGNGDWGNFFLTGNVSATGTSSMNADIALRATNVDFSVATGGTLNVGGTLHNGHLFGQNSGSPSTVSKSGDGTMVLSTAHTYTGATNVNAGKLLINGSTSTSSAVTVASGATLGGTGTVGGATTINGTHAPGNSPGVQSFAGSLSYTSTSIFEWDLASSATGARGTQYDGVNVAGTLSGATGAAFKVVLNSGAFTDTFWNANQTWSDIFKANVDGSGSPLGIASVFSAIQWFEGTTNMTSLTGTQGYFTLSGSDLNWTAVPEPTSALAGLLLAAGLLRRRR